MFEQLLTPTAVPCSLGYLLSELDEASSRNLLNALERSRDEIPHRAISRAIKAETGRAIDPETVAAHRAKGCRCSTN